MDDKVAQASITKALAMLAASKDKSPSPEVYEVYAGRLIAYPLEAVRGACEALMDAPDPFFPPLGRIIAEIARWLRGCVNPNGVPTILPPDEAWKRARSTIAAYQPQTRPAPCDGNPAIDGAIAAMGGVVACQWVDHVGRGIVQRRFLEEYERAICAPEHVAWALSPLAAAPRSVPGLEMPDHERERLRAAGEDRAAAMESLTNHLMDGLMPPSPYALPAPLPAPLTPERREALRAEFREQVAALVASWSLHRPGPLPIPPLNEGDLEDRLIVPEVDVSGVIAEARADRLARESEQREQARARADRYGE